MAAIANLADPFARTALTILRGTGIRLGELLDLELDCVWDSASHGSWLKVPIGKLGTERTVPLDADTLAALDEWMQLRGPERALPHPRLQRAADFLFVERGRRLSPYRLRQGLDEAAATSGLRGREGRPLHVTPHQLRHTYATSLVNFVSAPEFIPNLESQLADTTALRDDAAERGWHTEVARHSRVIASIEGHLTRLTRHAQRTADA
jgi:integrase